MSASKLLGLNLIVGPGEEKELERCLKSCQGPLFDEIIVTVTCEDEKVKAVAERYATKVAYFKWVNDFSLARNYSFSQSSTVHIFWIDSDDVIKPPEYQKLLELKPNLNKYDMVLIDYIYSHDDKDGAVLVLPRERIVRNCEHIKWHDCIHEYMNMDIPPEKILRTHIKLDHYRIKPFNPARNIDLLKQEYDKPTCSERIKFYYGKELADVGRMDEAVPVLEDYVKKGADFKDNLTVACIRISKYYYDKKDLATAKIYALKGVRFNPIYAENYVCIGIVCEEQGDKEAAEKYYKEALTKKLEGGMSQIVDFYGFIPAAKLAVLYLNSKKFDEALEYADMALKHRSDNGQILEIRKIIVNELEKRNQGTTLDEEYTNQIKKYFGSLKLDIEFTKNNMEFAEIRIRKPKKLEIVWLVPVADLDMPSIRIRHHNVSERLNKQGVLSRIISGYYNKSVFDVRNEIADATVVIFTQCSKQDYDLLKHLKSLGIKVVVDHCEALFGYPCKNECMKDADLVTCCSTKLEELTQAQGISRTMVLRDAAEADTFDVPHQYKRDWE